MQGETGVSTIQESGPFIHDTELSNHTLMDWEYFFLIQDLSTPEVLISAKAMQAGMDILRPKLIEAGAKLAGKVVVGTVKGDLHNIGKNLKISEN